MARPVTDDVNSISKTSYFIRVVSGARPVEDWTEHAIMDVATGG